MKAYIEENQARRIATSSSVIIKLMKDANNKAFGANTQRIKDRIRIVLIINKTNELTKLLGRCPDFEATLTSEADRKSLNLS